MQIFKLVPKNVDHNDWRSSNWRQPVLVRAGSENAARWAASLAFRIAVEKSRGTATALNPWRQQKLTEVICLNKEEANIAGFSTDGPVEILDPPACNEALIGIDWNSV